MSFTALRSRWMRIGAALLVTLVVAALWSARDTLRPATASKPEVSDRRPGGVLTSREIARRAMAAAVHIRSLDVLGTLRGDGTGFFVSKDGLLATSLHVIRGAHSIEIETLYGSRFDSVQFVKADGRQDLAILKVKVDSVSPLALASAADPEIGEPVFVIGNPLGQTGTFTNGLVSARRASQGITYLQISAPIAPGSSGGPVMNERGEVLGVTTLRLQRGPSLNFAVPVRYLQRLLNSADSSVAYTRVLLPRLSRPPVFSTDPTAVQTGRFGDPSERDVIARQLHKSDSLLKNARGTAEGETIHATLAEDDTVSRLLRLTPGRQYVMTGYCDEHCSALSLAVRTPDGRAIDADLDIDDTPKLRFIAPPDGHCLLEIVMSSCDEKTCRVGVRTYVLSTDAAIRNR